MYRYKMMWLTAKIHHFWHSGYTYTRQGGVAHAWGRSKSVVHYNNIQNFILNGLSYWNIRLWYSIWHCVYSYLWWDYVKLWENFTQVEKDAPPFCDHRKTPPPYFVITVLQSVNFCDHTLYYFENKPRISHQSYFKLHW